MNKNVARIYQPSKTAMQSGRAKTLSWVLEFEPSEARHTDPLMGWVSSGDTLCQVKLKFPSKAEAVSYANREGISYHITEPRRRRSKAKNYAENFSYQFRFK